MKFSDGTEFGDGTENEMLLNASNNTWFVTEIMFIDLRPIWATLNVNF